MDIVREFEVNGTKIKGLTTRTIADMMDMAHGDVLKKLDGTVDKNGKVKIIGIIPTLNKGNFPLVEYFIESTYIDAKGEKRKEYICTKMGCEFLANKFTGEKGILFTAQYVKLFNEMEQEIKEIQSAVEEKDSISKEEFYEIHFKTKQRVRKAFMCPFNEYELLVERYLEFVNTHRDTETRIKLLESLKSVLEEEFKRKRTDLTIEPQELTLGFGITRDIQLMLEEKLETIKNRSYGAKIGKLTKQ